MRPRTKSSLLWGAVGVLAFLAATQAYQLLVGGLRASVGVLAAVALAVGALVAAATYLTEHRLTQKGRT